MKKTVMKKTVSLDDDEFYMLHESARLMVCLSILPDVSISIVPAVGGGEHVCTVRRCNPSDDSAESEKSFSSKRRTEAVYLGLKHVAENWHPWEWEIVDKYLLLPRR